MNRRRFIFGGAIVSASLAFGGVAWTRRWNHIVIHHSAGASGDIEFLQRVHRQRQSDDPIDAIPYHYVIGNGKGLGDGEVASDWRQSLHIWGAHVSANNMGKNLFGLGICLIGNLEKNPPSTNQYESLVAHTKGLMEKYSIPLENVSGHGYTEGESTKCPGKYFPMQKFLKDIA